MIDPEELAVNKKDVYHHLGFFSKYFILVLMVKTVLLGWWCIPIWNQLTITLLVKYGLYQNLFLLNNLHLSKIFQIYITPVDYSLNFVT